MTDRQRTDGAENSMDKAISSVFQNSWFCGDAVTRPIPPDSADRARTEWIAWQLEQVERMA